MVNVAPHASPTAPTASTTQTAPTTSTTASATPGGTRVAPAPAAPGARHTGALTAAEVAALALSLAHLGAGPQAAVARQALSRLLDAEPGRPLHAAAEGGAHAAPRDPAGGRRRARAGSDEVIAITLATLTTPLDGDTAGRAKVLADGISERHAVRLHYRDAKGTHSVRHVEPVTCLVHRDHWYLVAWCRLRRGVRAFRLDRVMAVEPTSSPVPAHRAERFLPFQRRAAA